MRRDAKVSEASIILRFVVMSAIHLLIGTVQGVMQTFPGIAQWLREAGPAGHMIDPLAHAHINLVGGVTMGMMGIFYYLIPRVTERRFTAACCRFIRSGFPLSVSPDFSVLWSSWASSKAI